jgi:hypothetical protein
MQKESFRMKTIIQRFIGCAVLFASLSLLGAPDCGMGHHQSGVIGQVQGPILLHDWDVLVQSDDGQFVTHFLTNPDGSFQVDLKPGRYVMVAYITVGSSTVPPSPTLVFGTPVTVKVEKKRFTPAVLPISLPPL